VEFARLTKTPYQNLMLDKKVLRIEERLVGHKPFLPREVVQHEIWTKCLYGLRFLKTSMVIDNDFHEKDAINYSPKLLNAIYFSAMIYGFKGILNNFS